MEQNPILQQDPQTLDVPSTRVLLGPHLLHHQRAHQQGALLESGLEPQPVATLSLPLKEPP